MNPIFSETAQPILIAKIYVIKDIKEVLKKIQDSIPFTRRGKKIIEIFQ